MYKNVNICKKKQKDMLSKDFYLAVKSLHRVNNGDKTSKKHIPSAISALIVHFYMGKIDKSIQNSIKILSKRV